jgi:hypothetical protein
LAQRPVPDDDSGEAATCAAFPKAKSSVCSIEAPRPALMRDAPGRTRPFAFPFEAR